MLCGTGSYESHQYQQTSNGTVCSNCGATPGGSMRVTKPAEIMNEDNSAEQEVLITEKTLPIVPEETTIPE